MITVQGCDIQSINLENTALSLYDLVILATDHSSIDYVQLVEQATAILDTRGITRKPPDAQSTLYRSKITLL
ncbi:hypothetical protein [Acaryochloris sp. IP29b_bin.137]|uniref:hypothetical protein n=1 Tax=Acaryochloris sp. IP29b_bin.137 TaxID=2969217 RepID=UPI0026070B9D|nr:hypothetical protein [Acaryochloris sp. IP29b_bin.137]